MYPAIEPYDAGMLSVGDGHLVYWETCGNHEGKPAVVLHGGPGSGCTPWHRRLFDPVRYRVVLFDQRGCGRSRPHAGEAEADLTTNTTRDLLEDIERLREHVGVDRWLVWGGSWGSVLALAYAERHPKRVSELILWGVATGRRAELDLLFRGGLAPLFPGRWQRLVDAIPPALRHLDVADAYASMLFDPDATVRERAAFEWCLWESVASELPASDRESEPRLGSRFHDPGYALAFARLVTHYIRHDCWIEDGSLLRNAGRLASIPGVIVHGMRDTSPLEWSRALHGAWPTSELVIVDDAGHDPGASAIAAELIRASDGFA
jgi:proline iminopeptidase